MIPAHLRLSTSLLLALLLGLGTAWSQDTWSLVATWRPAQASTTDDDDTVLGEAVALDQTVLWRVRSRGQGTLSWEFPGQPPLPPLVVEGLLYSAGQPVRLAFSWSPQTLLWFVDGKLAVQRISSGLAGPQPAAFRLASPALASDQQFRPGLLDEAALVRLEGPATGQAWGKIPVGRASVHPPAFPPLAATEPGLLLCLDFANWPVPHTEIIGKAAGVRPADGGMACLEGGLRCRLRQPLGTSGTIALWARPTWSLPEVTDSHVFVLVQTDGPATDNFHLQTWGGALSARAGSMANERQPGADPRPAQPVVWPAGTWRHLALVWSPESARLYLDGQLVGKDDEVSYPHRAKSEIYLGCWTGGSRPAQAVLDEVRVYDRNLTEEEVRQLASRAPQAENQP